MAVEFKVEIAFSGTYRDTHVIGSTTYPGPATGWTDVSVYVDGFGSGRGRNNEFDEIETGTLTVRLDNQDGRFTPKRSTSPYYPNIVPGKPVRVTASADGWVTSYPVFYGFAERWPLSLSDLSTVELSVTDIQAFLAKQDLKSPLVAQFLKSKPLAYLPLSPEYGLTDLVSGKAVTTSKVGAGAVLSWERGSNGMAYLLRGDGAGIGATLATSSGLNGTTFNIPVGADFARQGTIIFTWAPDSRAATNPNAPKQTLVQFYRDNGIESLEPIVIYAQGRAGGKGYSIVASNGSAASGALHVDDTAPVTVCLQWIRNGASSWDCKLWIAGPLTGGAPTLIDTFTDGTFGSVFAPGGYGPGIIRIGGLTPYYAYPADTMASGMFGHVGFWDNAQDLSLLAGFIPGTSNAPVQVNEVAALSGLLDAAGLSTSLLSADAPLSKRAAFDWSGTVKAIEPFRSVAVDSGGVAFPAADGRIIYKNRHARISGVNAAEFVTSDNSTPLPGLTLAVDDQHIVNDATLTFPVVEGVSLSVKARATDQASIDAYGRGTVERESLVVDSLELADAASWLVSVAAQPSLRVEGVSFDLASFPFPSRLLALDVGSRIRLEFPPAAPYQFADFFVEHVSFDVTADGMVAESEVSLKLSPAEYLSGWVLQDATLGVLDSTARLVY